MKNMLMMKNGNSLLPNYLGDIIYYLSLIHILGATEIKLRTAVKKDGPLITENNNFILDTKFEERYETLEKDIKEITGVIELSLIHI